MQVLVILSCERSVSKIKASVETKADRIVSLPLAVALRTRGGLLGFPLGKSDPALDFAIHLCVKRPHRNAASFLIQYPMKNQNVR